MLGGGRLPGFGGLRPSHWRPTGNSEPPSEGEGLLALGETGKRHTGERWAGQHEPTGAGSVRNHRMKQRVDGREAQGPEPRERGKQGRHRSDLASRAGVGWQQ